MDEFESNHPGLYAMGDRAGVVGFLMDSPLIQLEGVVMDADYLDLLEREDDIETVLNRYDVDYYIGTDIEKLEDNCFFVVEPKQSRGHSRRIESKLCWKEIYSFEIDDHKTYVLQRPRP